MAQPEQSRPNPLAGDSGSASSALLPCLICSQRIPADVMGRHLERKHVDYRRHACQDCNLTAWDWRMMGAHAEQHGHKALLNSNMNSYTERLVKKLKNDVVKAARGEALSASSTSVSSNSIESSHSTGSDPTEIHVGGMKDEPKSREATPKPGEGQMAPAEKSAPKEKKGRGRVEKAKKAAKGSLTCLFPGCEAKIAITGPSSLAPKRRHIESAHLPQGVTVKCLVEGCPSAERSFKDLNGLSAHIRTIHRGVECLTDEQREAYRQLRQEVNTSAENLLSQCFPDARANAAATEEVDGPMPTRRRRSARRKGAVPMETSPAGDEQ